VAVVCALSTPRATVGCSVSPELTNVVDLDEDLIEKIAAQSDKQAGGLSIRELERIRNENLVGILQSLKAGRDGEGWGAGKLLAEFEERLRASAPPPATLI
jgi:carnitine 3-dehydrogenase